MNAACCILIGDPACCQRFGFRPSPHLAPDNEPAEFFMILPMGAAEPGSAVEFHPAFRGD
jgi:putative acetyltransferase